jgi:DNA-binding response OmpR family regulator
VNVLIVEDDEAIATSLALNLKLAGRSTAIARDGDEAVKMARVEDFELVLLDLNLPKQSGLDVLSALRDADNLVPVIVVSARHSESDKVAALRLGADDYVTKPFALAELLARIDAVLRRAGPPATAAPTARVADTLGWDDYTVDRDRRAVFKGDQEIQLTRLEFELLAYLVRHPGQVFTRAHLFRVVWANTLGNSRTVDNFVRQLRKHFEIDPDQPRHFITVRGTGYRFDP